MRENAAQTEPAARLVAVTNAIAQHVPRDKSKLAQAAQRSAARVLLLSLQGVLHRPAMADRARLYAQRTLDILGLLDRMEACDPGLLQKALTLADQVVRALRESDALTVPVPAAATKGSPCRVLPFNPLAVTESRNL